eukprot:3002285-Amphidinium_carterae.1
MVHAKSMLGLMEPEQLAPYGYEVQDSKGVRDRLDTSANTVTPVNHIKLVNDRKVGVMTTLMFMLASGQAPVRAAGSVMETTTTSVVLPTLTSATSTALLLTTLLFITVITTAAVINRMRMSPMSATTRVTQ